jgi:hypothetical protein
MRHQQLRIIDGGEVMPQLHHVGEVIEYPAELTQLTDQLADHGHVELGHLVLAQFTKFERLKAFCNFIVTELDT